MGLVLLGIGVLAFIIGGLIVVPSASLLLLAAAYPTPETPLLLRIAYGLVIAGMILLALAIVRSGG